jgi:hypothetical protein
MSSLYYRILLKEYHKRSFATWLRMMIAIRQVPPKLTSLPSLIAFYSRQQQSRTTKSQPTPKSSRSLPPKQPLEHPQSWRFGQSLHKPLHGFGTKSYDQRGFKHFLEGIWTLTFQKKSFLTLKSTLKKT